MKKVLITGAIRPKEFQMKLKKSSTKIGKFIPVDANVDSDDTGESCRYIAGYSNNPVINTIQAKIKQNTKKIYIFKEWDDNKQTIRGII